MFSHFCYHVNGKRKYDGRVLFRRYLCQRLKISELKSSGRLGDYIAGFLQSARCLLLSLCSDHLSPGLPGSLGLRSHRSLQLHWKAHVLHLVVVMVVMVVVMVVVVMVVVVRSRKMDQKS